MRNRIGLKRGFVELSPYCHEWTALYEETKNLILEKIGDLIVDIQHVGSTSIPGLPAKPIIDVVIAVENKRIIPRLSAKLNEIGIIDRGDQGEDGGHLFVIAPEPEIRTFHIHVVEIDDPQWNAYLSFRDALRADDALRDEYAAMKRELKRSHAEDRNAYTAGKSEFITKVNKKIIQKAII